jgi:hypothetical protein
MVTQARPTEQRILSCMCTQIDAGNVLSTTGIEKAKTVGRVLGRSGRLRPTPLRVENAYQDAPCHRCEIRITRDRTQAQGTWSRHVATSHVTRIVYWIRIRCSSRLLWVTQETRRRVSLDSPRSCTRKSTTPNGSNRRQLR